MVRHSVGGVLVVGRANDGDALRIRSFLGRNGYPHRALDLETNPDARALLERLAVAADQLSGTSSKIENYLGFPTGISEEALAGRAQVQANKFGAKVAISRNVVRLDCQGSPYGLELEGGEAVAAKAVVVATGVRYRRLDVPG